MLGFDYLKKERHLTEDTIKTFRLGYYDSIGNIYTNYDLTSVLSQLDQKFVNSVLFPIFDVYDNLIGISARKLNYNNSFDMKYVNTIYSKTQHLFGLNITWKDCLKQNKVYVVEGNIDVLMTYQSGIRNVVGMLGSVLKLTQLCLLSRFVKNVVLVPDGDKVGQKFLEKMNTIQLFKKYPNLDLNFSVVTLPEGYDPDKFLYEKGKDAFLLLETKKEI